MMAAIDALHQAVAEEELAHQAADEQSDSPKKTNGPRTISLKQRVVPFVDMLRRAHAEDKEVVWGV